MKLDYLTVCLFSALKNVRDSQEAERGVVVDGAQHCIGENMQSTMFAHCTWKINIPKLNMVGCCRQETQILCKQGLLVF